MIIHLDISFDEDEKAILDEYIGKYNQGISVMRTVDSECLVGVENPNRIIAVGGLCLLEEKDQPKEWYMGQLHNGIYTFWGNYGNLRDALHGL